MILAKLTLLTLITLQSLRMMVARPTLLLSVPDVMLKPQPVTELFQTHKQELMDRMTRELATFLISKLR